MFTRKKVINGKINTSICLVVTVTSRENCVIKV